MTQRLATGPDSAPGDARAPDNPAPARRGGSIWLRIGALATVAVLSVAAAVFIADPGHASPDGGNPDAAAPGVAVDPTATTGPVAAIWQRSVVSPEELASRVGVRVTQLAVTGDGGLLDLRVVVLDPEKAAALHDQANPIAIVDEATGVVANNLLMSHSHTAPFQAGLTYYWVFENPGSLVPRGATVNVLLGSSEIDHVEVH